MNVFNEGEERDAPVEEEKQLAKVDTQENFIVLSACGLRSIK
ncbi:hypothetical protein [Terrilactibacillus tamarindi]|nr:hypothetical protein [Terrilactibacillus tamarindi]